MNSPDRNERVALAIKLAGEGLSSPQIAERTGFTKSGVRSALLSRGIVTKPMQGKFSWDEASIARLRELVGLGETYASIAKIMVHEFKAPISRNAAIGKALRLGLAQPRAEIEIRAPKALVRQVRAPLIRIEAARDLPQARTIEAAPVAPLSGNGPSDDIATDPKALLHPDFDDKRACRWPLVRTCDDGSVLYCCNARSFRETFCEVHARWADPKHRTHGQIRAEAEHKERMRKRHPRGRVFHSAHA